MANLITEGFDWFPSGQNTATRDRLWDANTWYPINNLVGHSTADVQLGRFDFGKSMFWDLGTSSNDIGYVIPIGKNVDTGFYGFAMIRYSDTRTSVGMAPGYGFFDAVVGTTHICVLFSDWGVVKVLRGPPESGTVLATSQAGAFQEDEWFHVEIKAVIADTGGSVEVRINTVPVIQLVGADTQNTINAYFDSVTIQPARPSASAFHMAVDDLFVNDTTGATCNDWLGNVRIKGQFMIANGATNNFAIGGSAPAATNWQSVLNNILDDTKYVYSPNVSDIDLYTPDPNLNSPLVHVVQIRMGLRQDDATQRVARAMIRIGATNYVGGIDQYTNQTFTFYKDRWEINPFTGVEFTGTEANGIQAGIKVQA